VPTPVGTNAVTSISRTIFHKWIIDQVFGSNPMLFRLRALNHVPEQGGYQIEAANIYKRFTNGGAYQGYDLLDISPNDTVKNAAWDIRQYEVPVSISGFDLVRFDHPQALANGLQMLFENAEMEMAENLGTDLWSDASTNSKALDGLKGAVDDGTVASTYGGLTRSSNTWFKSQIDSSTTTLTLASMNTLMGNTTVGGRHPTIIVATQANYNRYWALVQANQAFPIQPAGSDEQLAQAGFTNLLFNGVPVLVDQHVPANHIFFINERYLWLYNMAGVNMKINDFIQPPNQDAYTSLVLWYGQVVLTNPARSGKMTALTA
jgi:hypothetical protein